MTTQVERKRHEVYWTTQRAGNRNGNQSYLRTLYPRDRPRQIRHYENYQLDRFVGACLKAGVSTQKEIRRVVKSVLGVTRLTASREVVCEVQARLREAESWASRRSGARYAIGWNDSVTRPLAERWMECRRSWVSGRISEAIRSGGAYRGTTGAGSDYVNVVLDAEDPGASITREPEWTYSYRASRPNYPSYHDWRWTFRLPPGYFRRVRHRLGRTITVEGLIVLDVLGEARTPKKGEEAVRVLVAVQRKRTDLVLEERLIYRRTPEHDWRYTTLIARSRYDELMDRPAIVRRPAGYRQKEAS